MFTRIIIWHSYIINLNSWSKNDSIKSTLSFIFYILIVRQIVKSVSQLFLLLRLVVFNLQMSRWNKFGDWYILKRIPLTIVLEKSKNMFRFKKFELKQYVKKMVLSDSGSRKKIYSIIVHASIEGRNHFEKSKYKCKITSVSSKWRKLKMYSFIWLDPVCKLYKQSCPCWILKRHWIQYTQRRIPQGALLLVRGQFIYTRQKSNLYRNIFENLTGEGSTCKNYKTSFLL